MSLRYALLGLLANAPASGYELTKEFDDYLGEYAWHAGHTRIYPELNRLAEEELIVVTEEGARGRRTYDVTPAGREALRDWMLSEPAGRPARNEGVLRLFLLSAVDPADAKTLLRRIIADSTRQIESLSAITAGYEAQPREQRQSFGRLAAEYGLRSHQTARDWAQWAMVWIDENNPD
ncbi:MAG: PadR family transcriptional regulator [Stackebrandtia sp.]